MSSHTIQCRSCGNHVARVPTLICVYPHCKKHKWGYSDDELRQMGFNIPKINGSQIFTNLEGA